MNAPNSFTLAARLTCLSWVDMLNGPHQTSPIGHKCVVCKLPIKSEVN